MTKQEVKELSLEVWEYLKNHPGIDSKLDLPNKIFDKIKTLIHGCPLCDYFEMCCCDCPLVDCEENSSYYNWRHADNPEERKIYATEIYNKIKAWEPK